MKTGAHLQMRWIELLVAACFVGVSLLVITDSIRVGNAWGSDGPEPGYFPFYIGCLLLGGASWVIVQTLLAWKQDEGKQVFAEQHEFNLMLRGIFMPPKATPAQVAYFIDVFQKVRQLPEWKEFMETGAFKDTFMKGQEFQDWLLKAEVEHFRLMREAGFLAK